MRLTAVDNSTSTQRHKFTSQSAGWRFAPQPPPSTFLQGIIFYIGDASAAVQSAVEPNGHVVVPLDQLDRVQATKAHCDLLIIDTQARAFGGFEQLTELRVQRPNVPLLLLIDYDNSAQLDAVVRANADALLARDGGERYLLLLPQRVERLLAQKQQHEVQEMDRQRLEQLARNLLLIHDVAGGLTSTLQQGAITERFVRRIAELVDAEGSSVWLWGDGQKSHLCCAALYFGGQPDEPPDLRVGIGEGVVGWTAQHATGVIVPDVSIDERFAESVDKHLDFETRSLLAVPLRWQDEVLGVLELVNKQQGVFTDDDRLLAETLAAHAAVAVNNARIVDNLDAFAETVAHELKSPVALTLFNLDEMVERFTDLTLRDMYSRLTSVLSTYNDMADLVQTLLHLAMLRHNIALNIEPLTMNEIISSALARLHHMTREHQPIIRQAETWPQTVGYAPWVEVVWTNYLSNAMKYGGKPLEIELDAAIEGEVARFFVRDNGRGLSKQAQSMIFAPLEQLGRTEGGHGLGLSIVRRLVEHLGGTVKVESALDQGSTFSFTLPLVETMEAAADSAQADE